MTIPAPAGVSRVASGSCRSFQRTFRASIPTCRCPTPLTTTLTSAIRFSNGHSRWRAPIKKGSPMKSHDFVSAWGIVALLGISAMALPTPGAAQSCDRACLENVAEKYLTAMAAHDPAKAPIAPGTRYTENGVELPLPDGLWRTAGP